jgi:hypothetical protein
MSFSKGLEKHELKNDATASQFYILYLTHAHDFLIGLTGFIEKFELCNYFYAIQILYIEKAKITAEQKRMITKLT